MGQRLSITVYGKDKSGQPLEVRDRSGGAARVDDLRISTQLPGGYGEATFTARLPAARLWPVDAGQTLVVRRGTKTVWWGWIEDVRRRSAGRLVEVGVRALGPYQTLAQRLIADADYDQYTQSSAALRQELLANCPEISSNQSGLLSTGVTIGPLQRDYWPVSDLARTVCDAGNAEGQRMLFAVWEPSTLISASEGLHSRNILRDPDFEGPEWFGWTVHDYNNGDQETITGNYVSATRSRKAFSTSAVASGYVHLRNANVPAMANTLYQFDYWYYFPPLSSGSLTAQVWVLWLGPDSYTTGTEHTYAAVGPGWHFGSALMTSPPGTTACIAYLAAGWSSGTEKYVLWDECYLCLTAAAQVRDEKPRAYLWPRDLTGWDYLLWTGRTEGVDVTETTRELANYVVASYGSNGYTAAAQDATSQSLYRRRDRLAAAGNAAPAALATALRDATLAQYAQPLHEAGGLRLRQALRPVTTARGAAVHLEDIRAGDRLRIADGPAAGLVFLVSATAWQGGVLTITPENRPDVPLLLARRR